MPNIPGISEVNYLTNESLFNLTHLPKTMVILGAGPIGIEMAQAFQRFGCTVTVVVRKDRILDKVTLLLTELICCGLSHSF